MTNLLLTPEPVNNPAPTSIKLPYWPVVRNIEWHLEHRKHRHLQASLIINHARSREPTEFARIPIKLELLFPRSKDYAFSTPFSKFVQRYIRETSEVKIAVK